MDFNSDDYVETSATERVYCTTCNIELSYCDSCRDYFEDENKIYCNSFVDSHLCENCYCEFLEEEEE